MTKFTKELRSGSINFDKKTWKKLRCAGMKTVTRGPFVVAVVWSGSDQFDSPEEEEENEVANAALFAAAPDLYAALEEIAKHLYQKDTDLSRCREMAKDALSKACL